MINNDMSFIKLKIARRNGFDFNQINKHYYLKLRIPIMHRHFFRKRFQNNCTNLNNPFHFACCQ